MDHMATAELSSRSTAPTSFHDLDELLLGQTDLEAMPFEFGCDFASAFEDKHLEVDAPGPSYRATGASSLSAQPRPKEAKRSHKRKSDSLSTASSSIAPRSLPALAPPATLGSEHDDLSTLDPQTNGSTQIGRWTKKEHELFLEGLRLYGKSWKKISSLVVTRTLVQIRTHAQKYLQKQTKSALKAAAASSAGNSSSSSSSKSKKTTVPQAQASDPSQASWKHHNHQQHGSVFLPIAFPGSAISSSSSSSSSSFIAPSSAYSGRKDLAPSSFTSMSKLDQLLHDDSHTTNGSDDYYSSPTGSDDDLVQWLQHRHLPYLSSNSSPVAKRRRTDTASGNAWAMVNPMEAIAAHNSASHASYYSNHGHHSADFLSSGSAYSSSSSAVASHNESEFAFGHSWL